jgi:phenylacetate-coenzyme A ligase PaaK-like adenylate-forming protein
MDPHVLRFGDTAYDVTHADREAPLPGLPPMVTAFVRDTVARCSFHCRRLELAGLEAEDVRGLDDFRAVPLLSPLDVARSGELALLPDAYRDASRTGLRGMPPGDRFARKCITTGSTGPAKVSYFTASDWQALLGVHRRQLRHLPIEAYCRAFLSFHAGHFAFKMQEDALNRAGCFVEGRHFTVQTTEETLRQMQTSTANRAGGFNAIVATPCAPPTPGPVKGVNLDVLLDADVENYLGRHVGVVITGGVPRERPGLHLRERFWEANDMAGRPPAHFHEVYGCSEIGPIGSECERNDGLHLEQATAFVEVVDPETRRHVEDGGRGLLVVTGLRHGSRFLRYVVGDEATYDATPCACGRGGPRIRDVARVLDRARLALGCGAG